MDADADKDLMWIARAGLKAVSWIAYENWNQSIMV